MISTRFWTHVIWIVFVILVLSVLVSRFRSQQRTARILHDNEVLNNTIPRFDRLDVIVESGETVSQIALSDPSGLFVEISGEFDPGVGAIVEPYLIRGLKFRIHLERIQDQEIIWRTSPSAIHIDKDRFTFRVPIFRNVRFKPGAYRFVVTYSGQSRFHRAFRFVEN